VFLNAGTELEIVVGGAGAPTAPDSAAGGRGSFVWDPTAVPPQPDVPEPSTWAMMLLGFAGLGLAGYRKAKSRSCHCLPSEWPLDGSTASRLKGQVFGFQRRKAAVPVPASSSRKAVGQRSAHGRRSVRSRAFSKPDIRFEEGRLLPLSARSSPRVRKACANSSHSPMVDNGFNVAQTKHLSLDESDLKQTRGVC
jgi:hypothetical protein